MMPRASNEDGFTLVELVVALFIFGLLAAAGASLLNFSVKAQAVTGARLTDVAGERRMSAILSGDLLQAVPRVTRDSRGAPEPAFSGRRGDRLLSYVRAGWSRSGDNDFPGLQRVELRLDQGQLIRTARTRLDGGAETVDLVLAEDVSDAQVRIRTRDGVWGDIVDATKIEALPSAVELTIVRGRGAPVRRVFLVGTGA
jgi:general secretion pathway protein J